VRLPPCAADAGIRGAPAPERAGRQQRFGAQRIGAVIAVERLVRAFAEREVATVVGGEGECFALRLGLQWQHEWIALECSGNLLARLPLPGTGHVFRAQHNQRAVG